MTDPKDHLRIASLNLSHVLDELGMNTLTVTRKRQAYLFREQMETMRHALEDERAQVSVYHFGSQSEGTTTPGLGSDIDGLYCHGGKPAIQDWPEWQQGKTNMLMLKDDVAPGYCRLQLLRPDLPMAKEYLPNPNFAFDKHKRVVLKNTARIFSLPEIQLSVNGPAHTHTMGDLLSGDMVPALKCKSWPSEAEVWTRKNRARKWPPNSLIKKAVQSGFFLVPVGHKLSSTECLEWRISMSLTERLLMYSLNITQLKCYVVLKMIMKSLIIPTAGESISSYHCKTALFHCINIMDSEVWIEDNLLCCINKCMALLLSWIINEHCPHFIIPESNLFAGKICARNKHILISLCSSVIDSNGAFLLGISIDELGHRIKAKAGFLLRHIPAVYSADTLRVVGREEIDKMASVGGNANSLIVDQTHVHIKTAIRRVYALIRTLCNYTRIADKYGKQVISVYIEIFTCFIGSMIASLSMSYKKAIPKYVLQWFRIGAKHDLSSKLKLASVFYCNGDFEKADIVLRNVELCFKRKVIQQVCGCYPCFYNTTFEFYRQMQILKDEKCRRRHMAMCVRFSQHEIFCAPPALQKEMSRSVGTDVHDKTYWDLWMVLGVSDAVPFFHYLQYLTYSKLANRELQIQALHDLDKCVRDGKITGHPETSWNLLGQCMEHEGQVNSALHCYRTSLQVRPKNNAAKWHISLLVHGCILNF